MITITALMENTTEQECLLASHGLSLYIETPMHKILFDAGPDGNFIKNAEVLNVDLEAVDTVILSHGHYDHGGGLPDFLKINNKANIYIRENAFGQYYTRTAASDRYIGVDSVIKENPNVIFTDDELVIDGELTLFSGINGQKLLSSANDSLYEKTEMGFVRDGFSHEQYLVITDGERQVLVTGCSHCGIINILEKYCEKYKKDENTAVVGGFHLYDRARKTYESEENIGNIANALLDLGGSYHTCHCTGEDAYKQMKAVMGEKLSYLGSNV